MQFANQNIFQGDYFLLGSYANTALFLFKYLMNYQWEISL